MSWSLWMVFEKSCNGVTKNSGSGDNSAFDVLVHMCVHGFPRQTGWSVLDYGLGEGRGKNKNKLTKPSPYIY